MSISNWLVAGAIFIIILTIAIGIGWWFRNNSNPRPAPPNRESAPLVWSKPSNGPDPNKNFCQLYQFPTSVVDINNVPTAVPGAPTFNPNILDNLQGVPSYPRCVDSDQIMAQQLQHSCTGPFGVIDDAITRCFLIDGGVTGLGGSESYYSDSQCFKVRSCLGQISLVSLNFQTPTVPDIFCIKNEGTGATVTMNSCDPSNNQQLFRITRINPGQNPAALQPGQGQNGLLAQILDRGTGLCLVPGNVTTSTVYDPSYLGITGCTGEPQTISGTNVVIGQCTGGSSPGYVWALLPSVQYCGVSGGCHGCTGCPPGQCVRVPNSNICSGCDTCRGFESTVTPQQIVYIGNLDLSQLPTGSTGYQGITGPSAVIKWLVDNNAQSLYYGGSGNGLILRNMGIDSRVCDQKPFTAQYVNLTTYNIITAEAACLAAGTLGTPDCTAF